MKTFEFEIIDSTTPMVEDNFYKWLDEQPNDSTYGEGEPTTIKAYLRSLGFDDKQHKIDEEHYERLKYIGQSFFTNWMPDRKTEFELTDLFKQGEGDSFWVRDSPFKRGVPTKKLVDMLEQRGLIYHLSPQNYYFEVIRNRLHIKYQHIIGGRRVCKLKGIRS